MAFADVLWSSGLRLREGGTLLTCELPDAGGEKPFLPARVGEGVAKGHGRDFWISRKALQRVDTYKRTSRRFAVQRAMEEGRYDQIADRKVMTKLDRRRIISYTDSDGRAGKVLLDILDSFERQKLFTEGLDGLEPLSLWLTDGGMPMPYRSWETVFYTANERCVEQNVLIHCHPHMLRHSFALRMLVTLLHAFDRRMNLKPEERREYRILFGDPWVLVQTLLGHSSLNTTRGIYLAPVTGLQIDLFLNGDDEDESSVNDLLSHIAQTSPRVQDTDER